MDRKEEVEYREQEKGKKKKKKTQKEEGKETKKTNVKLGVIKHHCHCHLRRKHTTVVTRDNDTHCRMAGGLISRGISASTHP